ncbi:MAG: chemotaxis protein [Deltaproteobacteria bacterium]|nr:MAG: chemotaxis protein [Deltaproteobacteria bacterium]
MLKSLRWKLQFMAVTLVLLMAIPLLLTTTRMMEQTMKERHKKQVHQESESLVALIDTYYKGFRQNVEMFSHSPLLQTAGDSVRTYITAQNVKMDSSTRGGIEEDIYNKFKEFGETHETAIFIFFGTRYGGWVGYPEDVRTHFDPRTRDWYKDAVANQGKVIQTEPYIDYTTRSLVVSMVMAVPGPDGQVAGVVGFDINNDAVSEMARRVRVGETGYVVLLHRNGSVFVDSKHPENNMKKFSETDLVDDENVSRVLSGQKIHYNAEVNGITYHVHSEGVDETDWIVLVFMNHAELHKTVTSVRNRLLGIAALVVLLVAIAGYFITSRLIRPMSNMVGELAAFEGDLTLRFQARTKDEIGALARWFNVFLEKLQNLLGGVRGETGKIEASVGQLEHIAATVLASSQGASQQANAVAAATEALNSNMSSVAAAMEQSATNVSRVASAAEMMNTNITTIASSVRSAAEISRDGVTQAQQTSVRMGELDAAARAISEVTETITEISEQTNLLALNATIEAARAGEAGKGFAVVANEIKELAHQTAAATGNIRDKIDGVQQTANASIAAINEIVTLINTINEIITDVTHSVDQQSITTQEIAENIHQASQGLNEVNENVSQGSVFADSINREIMGVNEAGKEIVAQGEDLNEQAEALNALVEKLKQMVGVFKV